MASGAMQAFNPLADIKPTGFKNAYAPLQQALASNSAYFMEQDKMAAAAEQRALDNARADARLGISQAQEADRVKDRGLLDTQRADDKLTNRFLAMEGTTSLPYTDIYNMAASKDPSLNKKFDLDEQTQNILDTHYDVLSKGQEAVPATPEQLKAALAAEAVQDSEYAKLDTETTAWGNKLENQDRISQAREAVRMFPDSPVAIKNLQDQLAARDSSQVTSAQNKQALAIKMAELGSKNTTSTGQVDQASKLAFTTAQSNLKEVAALSSDVAGNLTGKQKQAAMDFIDKEIGKKTPAAVIKAKMAAGMGMTNNWVFDDTTTFDVSKANKALGDTYKGKVDYSAGMPGTVGNTTNTKALNALQSQLDMLNRTPEEIKASRDAASVDSLLNRFGLVPVTPPIVTPPKTGDNTKTGKDGKTGKDDKTPIVEVTQSVDDKNTISKETVNTAKNALDKAIADDKENSTKASKDAINKARADLNTKKAKLFGKNISEVPLRDAGFIGNTLDFIMNPATRLVEMFEDSPTPTNNLTPNVGGTPNTEYVQPIADPFFSSGKRPLPRKEELAAARSIMIDNNPDTTKEQKARSKKMNNFVNNIPSDNPSFIEDLFDNLTNIEAPFTNKLTGTEATNIRDSILNKLSKSSTKFLSEDDILRITSSPDFQKLGDAYKKPILDRIAKRKKVQ